MRSRFASSLATKSFVVGVSLACRDGVGPAFPDNVYELAPLVPYATWWNLVESCSGVTRPFSEVSWYSTDAIVVNGTSYSGYWFSDGNRIVLRSLAVWNGGAVRHEMVHAILQRGDHPRQYFVDRCGPLTPCERECGLSEATRGVPSSARRSPTKYSHCDDSYRTVHAVTRGG